jgi:formylglycine-generating enzyme required for sulfatase activity
MALVDAGTYRPLFPPSPDETEIAVPAFQLDVEPVTNAEFLTFVIDHPEWQRDRVSRLFAEDGYLADWAGPTDLGDLDPLAPVVDVPWFAARAFCRAGGGDLATTAQWERAAAASETSTDASRDPVFAARILDWYARPDPARLPPVGQTPPNAWGIRDLHGLVWEWTLDFNSGLVSSDSRDPGGFQFCGLGATASSDPVAYAAFLRMATRSALRARSATSNLGFRCAAPAE